MRIRQSCAAVILDGIHGRLDAQPSNLRALRAYWVLVGMIYTRLAEKDSPIKTGELVALAKVYCERRAVKSGAAVLRKRGSQASSESASALFHRMVRDVYGVNMPGSAEGAGGTDERVTPGEVASRR